MSRYTLTIERDFDGWSSSLEGAEGFPVEEIFGMGKSATREWVLEHVNRAFDMLSELDLAGKCE